MAHRTGKMESTESRLSRIDLNLLTAFHVLMEERSVTGAANRLFISQPAMSKTLRRLRDLLGDELFIPSRHGLIPTPRAEELSAPIGIALSQLASSLFSSPFDPLQISAKISLQIPDSLSLAVIPSLHSILQQSAPHIQLTVDNLTDDHLHLLAGGKIDFSIYVNQDYGKEFITAPIGLCPSACWMRSGHPLNVKKSLSMHDVLAYPLVVLPYHEHHQKLTQVSPEAERIEQFYRDYQLDHVASLKTPQLLTALAVIIDSNALLLGPTFLFNMGQGSENLITRPVKDSENFNVPFHLIQHRRTEHSPLHSWLQEKIRQSWCSRP